MISPRIYLIVKALTLLGVLAFAFPFWALSAEQDGGDIWFKDTKKFAPVLFSHDKHSQVGNQCTDCHDKIFKKQAGSTDSGNAITMETLQEGQYCGTCHNKEKAFSVKGSCKKCHVKP